MSQRKMRLVGWLGTGTTTYHLGSWRYPGSRTDRPDADWLCSVAQTLEGAKFDSIFFADSNGLKDEVQMETGGLINLMDPTIVGTAIARATEKIGIGITVSTAFVHPFAIARSLGTLDYISNGRVAWNIVTSGAGGAREFGIDPLPKSERYRQAAEFLQVSQRLWNSFPTDAIVADQESGNYIDLEKIDQFDHEGEFFKAGGPLNAPLSAQGGPVIVQAGGSEDGRNFAAEHAELVFVMANTAADIRAYVEDLQARAKKFGRPEHAIQVVAAINVVAAETEAIAREQWQLLTESVNPKIALQMASGFSGIDLMSVDPASKISDYEQQHDDEQSGGIAQLFDQMMRENGDMTVLEAAVQITCSAVPTIVGDAEQVSQQMIDLFDESAVHGFMISSPIAPAGFEDFARLVVPRLQAQGYFRTEYEADTLRGRLSMN